MNLSISNPPGGHPLVHRTMGEAAIKPLSRAECFLKEEVHQYIIDVNLVSLITSYATPSFGDIFDQIDVRTRRPSLTAKKPLPAKEPLAEWLFMAVQESVGGKEAYETAVRAAKYEAIFLDPSPFKNLQQLAFRLTTKLSYDFNLKLERQNINREGRVSFNAIYPNRDILANEFIATDLNPANKDQLLLHLSPIVRRHLKGAELTPVYPKRDLPIEDPLKLF